MFRLARFVQLWTNCLEVNVVGIGWTHSSPIYARRCFFDRQAVSRLKLTGCKYYGYDIKMLTLENDIGAH